MAIWAPMPCHRGAPHQAGLGGEFPGRGSQFSVFRVFRVLGSGFSGYLGDLGLGFQGI